jgi:hypothetical protein
LNFAAFAKFKLFPDIAVVRRVAYLFNQNNGENSTAALKTPKISASQNTKTVQDTPREEKIFDPDSKGL